jgi:zinc/manganese transport system substrate-binding protein
MNRFAFLLVTIAVAFGARDASALDAFACEPEWGSLLHELAGDAVSVDVGTTALQDVHVIEAKPSLIAKVR